jgi:hypothetical protein
MNSKGAALPSVIMIFAVIMIFSASLVTTNVSENLFQINQEQDTEAYYVARSGVETVAASLIQQKITNANFADHVSLMTNADVITSTDALGDGSITVSVTRVDDITYEIEADSVVDGNDGHAKLVLSKSDNTLDDLFNHAIFANQGYNVVNDVNNIVGTIGSGGSINYANVNNNTNDIQKIPTFTDSDNNTYDKDNDLSDFDMFINENIPIYYTPLEQRDIDLVPESAITGSFTVNGTTDVFDTAGYYGDYDPPVSVDEIEFVTDPANDLILVFNTMNLKQQNIIITGGGNVIIYVREEVYLSQNTHEPKAPDPAAYDANQLLIMMAAEKLNGDKNTLSLSQSTEFKGFVYAAGANVEMQAGGSYVLTGAIIADYFETAGNVDIAYIAPDSDNDLGGFDAQIYTIERWED